MKKIILTYLILVSILVVGSVNAKTSNSINTVKTPAASQPVVNTSPVTKVAPTETSSVTVTAVPKQTPAQPAAAQPTEEAAASPISQVVTTEPQPTVCTEQTYTGTPDGPKCWQEYQAICVNGTQPAPSSDWFSQWCATTNAIDPSLHY